MTHPTDAGRTPDPDPADTPGLEPGGGVQPGDTPPGESSTSSAHWQSNSGSATASWIPYVIIGVTVVFVLLFFVGYISSLLG
ncbi:DUF6480 family protein [Cellulomonas rhizosphaerae]|uniref:Uncharacterized protein n=1 Tax=Cellulomonas rhizosphaerae TaxID=2293719 RepID=A0A413RNY3_9CELL|nr:DUF6480 family protein [Cellulomonas rhizosphaerae]RHA43638.1 hypothetical protein D1825_05305 [Cellulomonas rhizosphaerae]